MRNQALLIDVGNSTTSIGVYQNREIVSQREIPTNELKNDIELIQNENPKIISSVVPALDDYLKNLKKATLISHKTLPIITLNAPNPEQFGADRLANALAGYTLVKNACLVVDAGTAITFCYVDKNGVYQGGAIVPGMGIASKALNDYTAKIPLIHVSKQDTILGKTTESAVQNGLYFGYIELINGMIARYKTLDPALTVIGTGNGLDVLLPNLALDQHEPNLILKGLAIWFETTYHKIHE